MTASSLGAPLSATHFSLSHPVLTRHHVRARMDAKQTIYLGAGCRPYRRALLPRVACRRSTDGRFIRFSRDPRMKDPSDPQ